MKLKHLKGYQDRNQSGICHAPSQNEEKVSLHQSGTKVALNRVGTTAHLATAMIATPLSSFLKSPVKIYTNRTIIKYCPTYVIDSILSIFTRVVSGNTYNDQSLVFNSVYSKSLQLTMHIRYKNRIFRTSGNFQHEVQ